MENSVEDIISNIRALVISSKGGMRLSDVAVEYKDAFGEDVPLCKMGYSTLEGFFNDHSKDFKVNGSFVTAVHKASSAHIMSLVSRQKSSKKRKRSKRSKSNELSSENLTTAKKSLEEGKTSNIQTIPVNNGFKRSTVRKKSRKKKITAEVNGGDFSSNPLLSFVKDNKTSNNDWYNCNGQVLDAFGTYPFMLMHLCHSRGIPLPTYQITSWPLRDGGTLYNCSLTIGNHLFTSSDHYASTIWAKEIMAKKAYLHLKESSDEPTSDQSQYFNLLWEFCLRYAESPPLFRSRLHHSRNNRIYYICDLKFNGKMFSSSPVEALDEYFARDLVAMKAWDYIKHGLY